jgi:para-aminobenzoate synthetase component I
MEKSFVLSNVTTDCFFQLAHHFSNQPGTFFLYSGSSLDCAQASFLALFPFETLSVEENFYTIWRGKQLIKQASEHPWLALNQWQQTFAKQNPKQMAFGWLSYEMGYFADPDHCLIPFKTTLPLAYWQRHAIVITFHHAIHEITIQINEEALSYLTPSEQVQIHDLSTAVQWNALLNETLAKQKPALQEIKQVNRATLYKQGVDAIQEGIRAGDVYQVNLAQTFHYKGVADPFSLFFHLNALNPAPFSAYIKGEHWSILSSSPERFLKKIGQILETRPIKGTIRRGCTPEEDQKNKQTLCHSAKDHAELLMITDLMRNDLGKISEVGSVHVPELRRCEAYTNVFHLVSIIRSKALAHLTPFEIIRQCFPGGSITGCPKLRAMEMIHHLEKEARGIYTGSIGYLTGAGDFDLNIAIRTLVQYNNQFNLKLGSGIVIDSEASEEYLETLAKGASLFKTLTQ